MTVSEALPDDVEIEPADTDDVDALADLWVELAVDQRRHGSHLRSTENRSRIRETIVQHVVTETALVARRPGSITGFVTFGLERGHFRQDVTRGIIYNIYVRDSARGEGIGSALLSAAEDSIEARGADVIALESMAENDSAQEFYRRHGYTPHRIELEKPINGDTLTTDDG